MSDNAQRDLAASANALVETVNELRKVISKVGTRLDHLSGRADRQRLGIALTGLGLVADLVLSIFMLVAYSNQAATSARLTTLVEQEEIIRSQVLCPMYKLFLGSYQPDSRKPGPDRDKYEQAFTEMRSQYAILRCEGDLVPPRSDSVTKPN